MVIMANADSALHLPRQMLVHACYAEVEQREVLIHVARQVSATNVRRSLYSKGSVEANPIGTVLWDADLREADLRGADIAGARF